MKSRRSIKVLHCFGKAEKREHYPPVAPVLMKIIIALIFSVILAGCSTLKYEPKVAPATNSIVRIQVFSF